MHLSLTTIVSFLLAGTAAISQAEASETDQLTGSATASKPACEFSIGSWNEGLVIPVDFCGKERLFVLDSGSDLHVIDQSIMPAIGLPGKKVRIQTSGDPAVVVHYQEKDLRLFGFPAITISGQAASITGGVIATDMSSLREVSDLLITGIVGLEFFRDKIIQIDFDSNRMRIYPADTNPDSSWGERLALTLDQQGASPSVTAKAGGRENRWVIDTGSLGDITLTQAEFAIQRRLETLTSMPDASFVSIGGFGRQSKGRLRSFELGSSIHDDLVAASGGGPQLAVGLGYLRRFQVTFDLKRNSLYLLPGKMYELKEDERNSGLALVRIERRIVVHFVQQGSAAERAGIKAGDFILEFDDISYEKCRLPEIDRSIREKASNEFKFLISRKGEQQKEVILRLDE